MKLDPSLALLACFLVGCGTSPAVPPDPTGARAARVEITQAEDSGQPLLLGKPLISRDAPCDGFRATTYSAEDPDGTRRLICISKEELSTLYAPDPPAEQEAHDRPSVPSPVTVFEIEGLLPTFKIEMRDP